ncbi:hypothetical protein ACS0TY_012252 [Phlomoides rotata]
MRGNSSSSSSKTGAMETEKLKEAHLSGAYIRSLVKQLSSSRTKDHEGLCGSSFDEPPQQHKKQVRRRLHTSRPYQERLLNMAEARREIVTALKFHRASMKQATEKQQETESRVVETQPFHSLSHQLSLEQEAKLKSRRNPRIYASNSSIPPNNSSTFLDNFSVSPGHLSPYYYYQPPPPLIQENLNFTLPTQTLGLNLNLQDLDSTFNCSTYPSSIYSTAEEIPCMGGVPTSMPDSGLHPVMDDKEIAEIRSIGEQYEMEWNDTLNLVNSAWWFKFLKPEDQRGQDFGPFDEVPAWLNANETYFQHLNHFCSGNYFEDPALPCMDIEEIEGMDGDWLA